jgi:hypothetical protein
MARPAHRETAECPPTLVTPNCWEDDDELVVVRDGRNFSVIAITLVRH